MRSLRRNVINLLACLLVFQGTARVGAEEIQRVTIFHTNDLEGRLLPSTYFDEPGRGGFARLVAMLGGADDRTLILDAGDALGESQLARFGQGALVAELMGRAGYTALAVGNHEFDYGLDTLRLRAQQMGCPLLGANIEIPGETPLKKWVLIERAGLKVALTGLLSPAAQRVINPLRNPGLLIGDPSVALAEILPEMKEADYVIALVHMEEEEALGIAQAFPDLDLVLAGGFRSVAKKNAAPHQMQLASGTRVLSTPGRGAFVGRVDIELARTPSGLEERQFDVCLLPLDESVAPDPQVEGMVRQQAEAYARSGEEIVGRLMGEVNDTPKLVTEVLRYALDAEVGMLNFGTLHGVGLAGEIALGDIRRLVRYDDYLVALDLKGGELVRLAAESKGRKKEGQRLVFAGYDPGKGKVNGRKLVLDETYRLATTVYLAEGGDGYFASRRLEDRGTDLPVLQQSIVDYVRQRREGPERDVVWKLRSKLNTALAWTGLSERASAYQDVSFLGGKSAMSWNALYEVQLNREMPSGRIENLLRSNYGQVRADGDFREAADRLQFDMTYKRETRQPAPFAALALNTVWTEQDERPLNLRGSAGLHKVFGERAKVRFGLGLERDFAAGSNDLGLEILPEYKAEWGKTNLSSSVKLFVGASQVRTVSLQQYNSLALHLHSDLHLTLDANFFAHRSDKVGAAGLKSELQAGLGYVWSDKWF